MNIPIKLSGSYFIASCMKTFKYILHISKVHVYLLFVAVDISFRQRNYFASEAQGFMNITLESSVPINFPYSVAILTLQSNPVSATGEIIMWLDVMIF